MRFLFVAPFVTALVLLLAGPASANQFGRLFPGLPPLNSQTSQELADLAQTELDPNLDSGNNCLVTTVPFSGCVRSGFTYFGQFIDHDLTLDTGASPTAPVNIETIDNQRTLKLDLDSVYGGGPKVSPRLYNGDKFIVREPNENGVRDVPREPVTVAQGGPLAGQPAAPAIIAEARNDENQIILQIQIAMYKAHNRLIDMGMSFSKAQRTLQQHYQMAIVNDYLPHILSQSIDLGDVLGGQGSQWFARYLFASDFTPVEFSVASFRFGHSQVRRAYRLNSVAAPNCGNLQVFALANPGASLMGGRPLQANRQIDWGMFLDEFPEPAGCEGLRNPGRKIDTLISSSLFQLPIPGAEAAGDNVLAFRNLIRAKFYDMPSGQDVARLMGLEPITPAELNLGPAFANGTPLWYYILAESERTQDGQRLGPVGSRINAAVFSKLVLRDPDSYARDNKFQPDSRITGADNLMTLSDLFAFAGVVQGSGS